MLAPPQVATRIKRLTVEDHTKSSSGLDLFRRYFWQPPRAHGEIIEERSKAKFKDFADLVKRGTLPSNVEADIKDKITF